MPAGWCAVEKLAHNGAQGARSVQGWITGAPAPAYPLHLEKMGLLSDRLRDAIAQLEAADRRAAELTADHVTATRAALARMAADTPGDPVADAAALLTAHGWTVTPPAE